MNSYEKKTRIKATTSPLEKLLARMPRFMHPQFELIETLDDLQFQVALEIDLGEQGDTDPRWTRKQLHSAKMYAGNVDIAGHVAKIESATR